MSMLDISVHDFLLGLKLGEYASAFSEKGILNLTDCPDITDRFLVELGVAKVGHRKRILREICRLNGNRNGEDGGLGSFSSEENLDEKGLERSSEASNKGIESPPPLPPKKSHSLKAQKPERPAPPRRVSSTKLPMQDAGTVVQDDLARVIPEVPPRVDLGESGHPSPWIQPVEDGHCADPELVIPEDIGVTDPQEGTENEQAINKPMPAANELLIAVDDDIPLEVHVDNGEKKPSVGANVSGALVVKPELPPRPLTPPTVPKRPKSSETRPLKPPRQKKDLAPPLAAPAPVIVETPSEPKPQTKQGTLKNSQHSDDSDSDQPLDVTDDLGVSPDIRVISMRRDRDLFDNTLASDKEKKAKRMTRMSTVNQRSGFLEKRGGRKGNKPFKKRWVVFNGTDLRYYEPNDKDTKAESLQIVPASRLQDVEIVKGAKRPQFNLKTPNRTFIFAHEDHTEIILWSQVLMQAILYQRQSADADVLLGSSFGDPDMEGWLKKQGHNIVGDWKDRYVAVKDDRLAYYYTFDDYKLEMPINTIEMKLATVKLDVSRHRLQLITPMREFWFETENNAQLETWKLAFDNAIQVGLGDPEVLNKIRENESNLSCADCGKKNPVWASTNLGVVVCAQCIGFHRHLGARISKARSILMDDKVWTKELVKFFQDFGNEEANKLWEEKLPSDDKISHDATKENRCEFIIAKYKEKRYFGWSRYYGRPEELGQAFREVVVAGDLSETMRLIISGVDIYYTEEEEPDQKTPYEMAKEAHQDLITELLRQFNGHLAPDERETLRSPSPQPERMSPSPELWDPLAVVWEKEGYLQKRGPKNTEPWKRRKFFLKDRNLCYEREGKEQEKEVIDLRKMISIELGQNRNDPTTINITLSTNRVYYMKGETVQEAEDWYTAIRNKQVIGVPIGCQEVNSKNIPFMVTKCVDYVESFALEHEGVYRLSGSQVTVKKLAQLFNQDAKTVHLTLDDYPVVHDVSSVLKFYLRELPDPLIESSLYDEFTNNCSESNHYTKLWRFKDLIARLPEVNKSTLRYLVLHLDKVVRHADKNKMSIENVVTIFGPILLSRGKTLDQAYLNREYAVMSDIITYYQWLFDVDEKDLEKEQQIQSALMKMKMAEGMIQKINTGTKIDDLQQTVYVNGLSDSCMVKINSKSTAVDVCMYVIKFKSLDLNGNWALFEMIKDGEIERPLQGKELVLPLVMDGGKSYKLLLKWNYVAEMTAPYQNSDLGVKGNLHMRKYDSGWKNLYFETKTGTLLVYAKKGGSEQEKLAIHEMIVYLGIEKKMKAPGKYGITIKIGSDMRCFCSDNEKIMNQWLAVLLAIRYPNGIWTNLQASDLTESPQRSITAASNYWGRQSTYLRLPGASLEIKKELQKKIGKLRSVKGH